LMRDGSSCPRADIAIMLVHEVITASTSRGLRQNRFRFKGDGKNTVLD
jgi:hypothetical protein